MTKQEARKNALLIRASISYDKDKVLEALKPYLLNKKVVGIYYPISSELSLLDLPLIYPNIIFVYPFVLGDTMGFRHLDSNGFKKGVFNTYEPTGDEVLRESIDLIIVPTLAINHKGYRLGYGKGYYDRYLEGYSNDTLAIIPKCLTIDFDENSTDVLIKEIIYL